MEIPSGTEMENILDKVSVLEQKRSYEHMKSSDITSYILDILNYTNMTLDIAIEMVREIDDRLLSLEKYKINETLGYNPAKELEGWLKRYEKEKTQEEVLKHD